MKPTIVLLIAILVLAGCQQDDTQTKTDDPGYAVAGEKHFGKIVMLTKGGENAEAYFSFDQKQLVFQSTSGEYECDQIFTMNLDGSSKKLISTGQGRTTCSFFMPGDSTIIYASTHHADENCPPKPDFSRGYVWQLYDSFDIFVADTEGNTIAQLTDTPGYDAEAVVAPTGDLVVFTSTRDGDPEIYTMNLDGSNQTRITHAQGYDGGPFFSPDGEEIVFRASRPQTEEEMADYADLVQHDLVRPTTLEIYVMNRDGSNIRQVTDFGKACFGPYFHPDGNRIIFASNVNSASGRDFDLYIINKDGSGFEQVTFNETFDGFPMFTRDGKHLVFASNRNNLNQGDTNVFLAEWID